MVKPKDKWNQLVLSGVVGVALAAFAVPAQAAIAGFEHRLADDVQIAQVKLQNQGLYNGPLNGKENHQTRVALREYQRNNDMRVTGRLDRETRDRLGLNATIPMR